MQGRKKVYMTPEELKEAKRKYNQKYYEKLCKARKAADNTEKEYSDEELKDIINKVGYERILLLLI